VDSPAPPQSGPEFIYILESGPEFTAGTQSEYHNIPLQ
jgi:hypothetical protein